MRGYYGGCPSALVLGKPREKKDFAVAEAVNKAYEPDLPGGGKGRREDERERREYYPTVTLSGSQPRGRQQQQLGWDHMKEKLPARCGRLMNARDVFLP